MATRSAETITNILQRVSDLRGETSINTDAVRIRFVSESEAEFARRKIWLLHLLRNQTITGDATNSYTIGSVAYPMRLKGLSEVFVGGQTEDKRVQVVDYFNYQNLYNQNNSSKLAYEYYDQANDVYKVYINPVPANTDTIYYSYFYMPAKKTLVTEQVVCPNMEYIIKMTMAYIAYSEDEDDKAFNLKKEAEQILGEIEGLETMPAVNQIKSWGTVQDRGMGGY